MPKPIDLKSKDKTSLRVMLENAQRAGDETLANNVLKELKSKGGIRTSDYKFLKWTPEQVEEVLQPFAEIARSIQGNLRTSYTAAGGLKIGRSKDDPKRMWVNAYSAIKTGTINADFACYIKNPGENPWFCLTIDGVETGRFDEAELGEALKQWRAVAVRARA